MMCVIWICSFYQDANPSVTPSTFDKRFHVHGHSGQFKLGIQTIHGQMNRLAPIKWDVGSYTGCMATECKQKHSAKSRVSSNFVQMHPELIQMCSFWRLLFEVRRWCCWSWWASSWARSTWAETPNCKWGLCSDTPARYWMYSSYL